MILYHTHFSKLYSKFFRARTEVSTNTTSLMDFVLQWRILIFSARRHNAVVLGLCSDISDVDPGHFAALIRKRMRQVY